MYMIRQHSVSIQPDIHPAITAKRTAYCQPTKLKYNTNWYDFQLTKTDSTN